MAVENSTNTFNTIDPIATVSFLSVGSRVLQRGNRSQVGSRRSHRSGGTGYTGLSGITSASLKREVQEAVAQEVAKVVQPLKAKLQSEAATRQRLEDMLRRARGGVDALALS